jgi:3-oxoadipate enol-lactonase
MATVRLRGVDLYYEQFGAEPQTLFLNGSGATIETSRPLISRLGRDVGLLAFDQRGLGRSGPTEAPYSMADLAGDAEALVDHLGWDRLSVVGVSFGGMVAQELAVTVPERIERLALLCTSSGGAGGSSYPLHTLAERSPEDRTAAYREIVDTRFSPEWLLRHPGDQAFMDMLGQQFQRPRSDKTVEGEARQMKARASHDTFDRLDRITCPTLIATGRFDGIAPPENAAAMAARIPRSELREFDGGHLFLIQDPSAFPAVTDFLAVTP